MCKVYLIQSPNLQRMNPQPKAGEEAGLRSPTLIVAEPWEEPRCVSHCIEEKADVGTGG